MKNLSPDPALPDSSICEKLRAAFEGREAIYIEQGVLRVRVTQIRCNVRTRQIAADVEEIRTPGLERSLFHDRRNEPGLLRWTIRAGYLTSFSGQFWEMGYGGWSLYFAPEVVGEVVSVAAGWPAELSVFERFNQAIGILNQRRVHASSQRVFPG